MRIDRCTCFNQTFAALKAVAEAQRAMTLPELQTHVTFGQKCQLCHPYVRRMLRTGEAVFSEIITEADEPSYPIP